MFKGAHSLRRTDPPTPRGRSVGLGWGGCTICHHAGEGRGPIGTSDITKRRPPLQPSPNWTPASAGEVQRRGAPIFPLPGREGLGVGRPFGSRSCVCGSRPTPGPSHPGKGEDRCSLPLHLPGGGRGPIGDGCNGGRRFVMSDVPIGPRPSPGWWHMVHPPTHTDATSARGWRIAPPKAMRSLEHSPRALSARSTRSPPRPTG